MCVVCVCTCTCTHTHKMNVMVTLLQVWNSNVLVDRFMGRVTVPLPWQGDSERHTKPLMGRGRNSNNETQGKITVSVSCSRDLQST